MRYCTSLSLNEKEYERLKETGRGVKEIFQLGLDMAERLKAIDDSSV